MKAALVNLPVQVNGFSSNMTGEQMRQQIRDADAIYIPGGNTFYLLSKLYEYDLLDTIRDQVSKGKPYIGSSAG